MANTCLKGRELMLFDAQKKALAFATSHTFSLNAETGDISSKDHGIWGASEVTKITWEITTENLYTMENYSDLVGKMIKAEPIDIYFGVATPKEVLPSEATGTPWELDESKTHFKGKVVITAMSANANNGENATYSATFTGASVLNQVTARV